MNYTELISLNEAKQHLNIELDYHDDDKLIEGYIESAIEMVAEDSSNEVFDLCDYDGKLKSLARQAALLQIGTFYAYRESSVNQASNALANGYDRLIHLIRNWR